MTTTSIHPRCSAEHVADALDPDSSALTDGQAWAVLVVEVHALRAELATAQESNRMYRTAIARLHGAITAATMTPSVQRAIASLGADP
jgi:hypothetical protein